MTTSNVPYTILHGDALERLVHLGEASADAVVTDPPYCSGAATEAGRGAATHQGLRSETIRNGRFNWFDADNMTTAGLTWLLRSVAVESSRILKDDGSLLVFCDWRMVSALAPAIESAGFRQRNMIVWDKGHYGCGTGFRPQHEIILHFSKRAPTFHAADVGNVIRVKRVPSDDRDHPTEKPVALIRKLIRVVSPPGGTIVDPFDGSGATGHAAIDEGRRVVLIEKEQSYIDLMTREIAAHVATRDRDEVDIGDFFN